jgi:hypothetical protein
VLEIDKSTGVGCVASRIVGIVQLVQASIEMNGVGQRDLAPDRPANEVALDLAHGRRPGFSVIG